MEKLQTATDKESGYSLKLRAYKLIRDERYDQAKKILEVNPLLFSLCNLRDSNQYLLAIDTKRAAEQPQHRESSRYSCQRYPSSKSDAVDRHCDIGTNAR